MPLLLHTVSTSVINRCRSGDSVMAVLIKSLISGLLFSVSLSALFSGVICLIVSFSFLVYAVSPFIIIEASSWAVMVFQTSLVSTFIGLDADGVST